MSIPYQFDPIPSYFRKNGWFKDINCLIYVTWAFGRCQSKARNIFHDHREIHLEPFEFISGRTICSIETGLSDREIRTQQDRLKSAGILEKSTSKSTSKFTVYKWMTHRFCENKDQQIDQQPTSNRPATDHKAEEQTLDLQNEESNLACESYEQKTIALLPAQSAALCLLPFSKEKKELQESAEMFLGLASINGKDFDPDSVILWLKKYSISYMMDHLHDMLSRKKIPDDFHAWFSSALQKNYVGEKKLENENKIWAERFVHENAIHAVSIKQKYCTLKIGCGKENYYFKDTNFRVEFTRKLNNLHGMTG